MVKAEADRDDAAGQENHRLAQRNSGRVRERSVPSLASALAVAFGLIGIDLAHLFEELPSIGSRDVRRAWTVPVTLLRSPGKRRFLDPFRHAKTLEDNRGKASWAPRACHGGTSLPRLTP